MTEPATENLNDSVIEADDAPIIPIRTFFLGGIFIILLFSALKIADTLFIPIVIAIFLKLVLQPFLRLLGNFPIPRRLAALLIIALLVGALWVMGSALAGPAANWAQQIPDNLPEIKAKLHFLSKPVADTQKMLAQAEDLTKGTGPKATTTVVMPGSRLVDKIMITTQSLASNLFTIVLLLFFMLSSGDTFLRRIVESLPKFRNKRQAVEIFKQIEQDISIYLMTITIMNAIVGLATFFIMWYLDVGDPMLWAAAAFILNYVPIAGPFFAAALFVFVGLMGTSESWNAALPAALYLVVHIIESTFITPHLLARRFTLNPVLVILSLIFWYWMWGLAGAILSVPILAMIKIICDRIERLQPLGLFIEGDRKALAAAAPDEPVTASQTETARGR